VGRGGQGPQGEGEHKGIRTSEHQVAGHQGRRTSGGKQGISNGEVWAEAGSFDSVRLRRTPLRMTPLELIPDYDIRGQAVL